MENNHMYACINLCHRRERRQLLKLGGLIGLGLHLFPLSGVLAARKKEVGAEKCKPGFVEPRKTQHKRLSRPVNSFLPPKGEE